MFKYLILALSLMTLPTATTQASDYGYYGFEPDIVTNYVATQKKMGYVRLTVELMVEKGNNLAIVEHHAPLLRDAIIAIIGQQDEASIKSMKGRAEIQLKCEEQVKEILKKETGQPLIKKLLFTQWLDN
ncbi:flagellar basal body-associated protein FliL [Colwellia sp. RSH04]|uniref:flagellar basal body-associated protein FliL n=1 Tax=Colwellia sp. RSH04 TaxID=2305464 RepID=UPI000E56F5C9|nr:flagellar basal body-associated protein FliL [Colwellia sp. RSH04]